MFSVRFLSFDKALAKAGSKKPHLLLGNGFSRACKDNIFAYGALFDRADFGNLSPNAKKAFNRLKTTDFEVVMEALRKARILIGLYSPKSKRLAKRLEKDADGLKEVLVGAIADSHPDQPNEVTGQAYEACKKFLVNFSNIYTLNYDLLLYWTLMNEDTGPKLKRDDGFRAPEEEDAEYVTWEPGRYKQNIFFLHGALHIFDGGYEIQKYTWSRTGIRLMDQIRTAFDHGLYPVFVAEGTSKQKMTRIRHSDYLARCYRSIQSITGTLFIYGHSLAENDNHFLHLIEKGKLRQVFIGLHSAPTSPSSKRIISRAKAMSAARSSETRPLEIQFYDSKSVKVWG